MSYSDELIQGAVDAVQAQLAVVETILTTPPGMELLSTPILLTLKEKLSDEQLRLNRLFVMVTQECERRKL